MERYQNKKICLVIPSLHVGGMERVMSELAGFFCLQKNIVVHLVMYGKNPEIFYKLSSDIIIHKPRVRFNNRLRLFYSFGRLIYLRRIILEIKPDTILSFGEYWNSFVLLSLLGLDFPVYISDRCSPVKKFNVFHSLLRKLLYPGAKGIITQSQKAFEVYSCMFKHSNIEIIGNPVKRFRLPNTLRENIILAIGRLIATKHFDRLIRIFSKLNTNDWQLIIIGGNALKKNNLKELQKLIKDYKLENRVFLKGVITNIDEYLMKSKIFAFTSSSEGFPNVIAEALSAGLPVISYDCIAGPSEMIVDGVNGFLVPVFDDEMFLEKLQLLVDDEKLLMEMSGKAIESIKRLDIEIIGRRYLEFILPENN